MECGAPINLHRPVATATAQTGLRHDPVVSDNLGDLIQVGRAELDVIDAFLCGLLDEILASPSQSKVPSPT